MICPSCKSEIPDDASICPACRTNLSMTRVMPRLQGSWCPACGALVPQDSEKCPKCGTPVHIETKAKKLSERIASIDEQDSDDEDSQQTSVMPRIDSAIPSAPDPQEEALYGREHLPRVQMFLFAAFASLFIVGGGIILITHPWDPSLTDTRATTAADVSTAGYPGEVDRLSGQDKRLSATDAATSTVSADEQTYNDLIDCYTELGQISKQADELEDELDEYGISGSSEEREQGYGDAHTLSVTISNLITSISNIEVSTTGTYTQDRDNMVTLANWLRNRIEAIETSWERSSAASNPQDSSDYILAPMQGNREDDGSEAYINLFNSNYANWMPQEK